MDMIFKVIEILAEQAVAQQRSKDAPATARPAATRAPTPLQRPRVPMAPSTAAQPLGQDPMYDGEGWRRAVSWLGIVVLIIGAAVWAVYMQGQP